MRSLRATQWSVSLPPNLRSSKARSRRCRWRVGESVPQRTSLRARHGGEGAGSLPLARRHAGRLATNAALIAPRERAAEMRSSAPLQEERRHSIWRKPWRPDE
jgi:hypothetical protein